ncbi:MAG TPA: class I SAM-dependent methyltransferase [Candidatus Hydrogenedens sp.]|nr:class I SAM-dependent methyltransferase [Candidatus Hydrogenedens sp.]HOK08967.1 class I SAM-dependent methyltransferase [Candidatus Hydrogenedens sp.]HPP58727.1 class I SAM-dependent methyltransferase [Candidatus Hydrogenedens sp.]
MSNKQPMCSDKQYHHQKEIIDFFDHHAPQWDSYVSEGVLDKVENLLKNIDIKPTNTILDIGCGTGILVPYLWNRLQQNGTLIEVDVSREMIWHGKMKFKKIPCHWLITDAHFLPLKSEIADVIICFSIFPHLIDKKQAITEHSRVLKKGGIWVVCHSQPSKAINEFHQHVGGVVANHVIPEINEITQFLKDANLNLHHFQDNEEGYLLIATR